MNDQEKIIAEKLLQRIDQSFSSDAQWALKEGLSLYELFIRSVEKRTLAEKNAEEARQLATLRNG